MGSRTVTELNSGGMIVRSRKRSGIHKRKRKKMKKKITPHISYTHREQRRRILTMSFKKLTNIQNPESILNKAVLINNMMRNIQNQIVFEANLSRHQSVEVTI